MRNYPFCARMAAPFAFGLALAMCGCQTPKPMNVCCYEFNGPGLLEFQIPKISAFGPERGMLTYSAADGERFRGDWRKVQSSQAKVTQESSLYYSMPFVNVSSFDAKWGWASSFGLDFTEPPTVYYSFMMHGSKGTMIEGIFLLKGSLLKPPSLLGAAKDNKNRRYRVVG